MKHNNKMDKIIKLNGQTSGRDKIARLVPKIKIECSKVHFANHLICFIILD